MKPIPIKDGEMRIDEERGVIWINNGNGRCLLRICHIPKVYIEKILTRAKAFEEPPMFDMIAGGEITQILWEAEKHE